MLTGPAARYLHEQGSSLTFKIWLLNDDYTTMEFAVCLLEELFELEHEDAVRIMLQTHEEGLG